jgi:hypothetical protein
MKRIALALIGICLWLLSPCLSMAEPAVNAEKGGEKPLKAAIFVQNRAGDEFTEHVDVLNDQLSSRLTEKGFSIIEKDLVASKFSEHRTPGSSFNETSALRIAQMLGADYLVVVTLNSYGEEGRTFEGKNTVYGTDNNSVIYNLRISLKVLEGAAGGTVYGDVVTASEKVVSGQNLTISNTDIIPKLIETGVKKIAENITDKIGRIREAKSDNSQLVDFTINCNIEGASVELDSASIGTTPGQFSATPGIHQLKISKEFTTPWEHTVNIIPKLKLSVTLALSEEGIQRYANMEQFKADMERMKKQAASEPKVEERAANAGVKEIPIEKVDEKAAIASDAIEAGVEAGDEGDAYTDVKETPVNPKESENVSPIESKAGQEKTVNTAIEESKATSGPVANPVVKKASK